MQKFVSKGEIILVFLGVAVGILTSSQSLFAQSDFSVATPAVPRNEFFESFDDIPKTSTRDIAGVRLGIVSGSYETGNFQIAMPPPSTDFPLPICVRAMSQDARFLAENPYTVDLRAETNQILISPITLAYADELTSYDVSDITLSATLPYNGDCFSSASVFLPRIGNSEKDILTVFVNSRNRDGSIRLTVEGNNILSQHALCELAGTISRIAFDLKCSVPVSPSMQGKIVNVVVALDDGFAVEEIRIMAYLPDSEP